MAPTYVGNCGKALQGAHIGAKLRDDLGLPRPLGQIKMDRRTSGTRAVVPQRERTKATRQRYFRAKPRRLSQSSHVEGHGAPTAVLRTPPGRFLDHNGPRSPGDVRVQRCAASKCLAMGGNPTAP